MRLPVSIVPNSAPRLIKGAIARLARLERLDAVYQRVQGEDLIRSALAELAVSWRASDRDKQRIPAAGAAVVLANHPTGMLDGMVLASLLLDVRSDIKILGNELLCSVPELQRMLIPVDLSATSGAVRRNMTSIRHALEHLQAGGLLLVFPAGEVSRFDWRRRKAVDAEWSPSVARLVRTAMRLNPRLSVTPVHVGGANSLLFHAAGALHPKVRLAMLPGQLLNKRGAAVDIAVGRPMDTCQLARFESDRDCAEYMRWRSYVLAGRPTFKPRTRVPFPRTKAVTAAPVMEAVSAELLADDIEALPAARRLSQSGELAVYLAPAGEIPNVLAEIGRLREITFRAAGEGTGKVCDRDRFDEYYQHLFIWNGARKEIVGAYRLALTNRVRPRFGAGGLYTAALFRYGNSLLDQFGPAIELGRSFIRVEYQKGFSPLLLLWKGIGRVVAMHPECRVLFGPVSITSQYQDLSRELMVAYLERRAPLKELLGFVASRRPFRPGVRIPDATVERLGLDDISSVISDIEPDGQGVPVLLRQYLRLGGRLLGFNVDPEFHDALDGLIVVDLLRTERSLLERYLGKSEAAAFLEYHNKEAYAA